jgi:hypothetical protein
MLTKQYLIATFRIRPLKNREVAKKEQRLENEGI